MTVTNKLFLVLAFLMASIFISEWGYAQTPKKIKAPALNSAIQISPLGVDLRFERGEEQAIETQAYLDFSAGYHYLNWSADLEYNQRSKKTGNAASYVDNKHQEVSLWGSYRFFKVRVQQLQFNLLVSGGLGMFSQEITTGYLGAEQTDKTGNKLFAGLGLGLEVNYYFTQSFGLLFSSQGRMYFSNSYDPNPILSVLGRAGILYRF